MLQIASSTAIAVLSTIAVVYFGVAALCTIIICHVARKRSLLSNTCWIHQKDGESGKDPGFTTGGRAGAWRHHMAHKPALGNGTSPTYKSADEERQGERSNGKSTTEQPSHAPNKTNKGSMPFPEKKKVRGRTLSTKPLLDRTDSIYSWGVTETDSGMDDVLSDATSQPALSGLGVAGQLNTSSVSLPRHPGSNTHTFPRRKPYISGSTTNLDHAKLRRASTSSRCSSTSSLNGPKVLCSPIASTSYRSRLNSVGKTRAPSDSSLFETVLEMEENYMMMRPRGAPVGVMRRATWSQSQHSMPRAYLKEVEEEDEHVFETKTKQDQDCNAQEATCV